MKRNSLYVYRWMLYYPIGVPLQRLLDQVLLILVIVCKIGRSVVFAMWTMSNSAALQHNVKHTEGKTNYDYLQRREFSPLLVCVCNSRMLWNFSDSKFGLENVVEQCLVCNL